MTIDRTQLVAYAPAATAIVIVALGWALFIRPLSSASGQDARATTQLRARNEALRRAVLAPVPARDGVDPAAVFRREVAARDAVPQLMEQLARLSSHDGAVNLMIETGDPAVVPVATKTGPQVAGASQPDPRLALFDVPLAYVPITLSFDADYARLGNLLWHLRDLPTLVEMRSLEVKPLRDRGSETLHATITLLAYGQQPNARVPAVAQVSGGPMASR